MSKRNYKMETTTINLSSTFPVRGRCNKCSSLPTNLYRVRNPTLWFDPQKVIKRFSYIKKYCDRMCVDYYFTDNPSIFITVNDFSHCVNYKGYNPRLHKNKGVIALSFTEFFTCDCGGMVWGVTEKCAQYRPEISNRKSRSKHSLVFKF
jgi:hypothetical protein